MEDENSANAIKQSFIDSKEELIKGKNNARRNLKDLVTIITNLKTELKNLENYKLQFDTALTTINDKNTDLTTKETALNELLGSVNETKTSLDTKIAEATEKHENLLKQDTLLEEKIEEFEEFYNSLTGNEEDDDNNGIRGEINQLYEDLNKTSTDYKEDRKSASTAFVELRKELRNKIESLLPGAGAAGLAGTYFEAKSKYGLVSLKEKPTKLEFSKYLLKSFSTSTVNIFYYIMFIAPLYFMTNIFINILKAKNIDTSINIGTDQSTASLGASLATANLDLEFILVRFLICTPLLIISLFGWSSIKMQRRLYEEYNHKQRVMQLYDSFETEVNKHGKKEHRYKLLDVMLKTVEDKPVMVSKKFEGFWKLIQGDETPKPET